MNRTSHNSIVKKNPHSESVYRTKAPKTTAPTAPTTPAIALPFAATTLPAPLFFVGVGEGEERGVMTSVVKDDEEEVEVGVVELPLPVPVLVELRETVPLLVVLDILFKFSKK